MKIYLQEETPKINTYSYAYCCDRFYRLEDLQDASTNERIRNIKNTIRG